MPTLAGMKALPWIAVIVLAVIAAVMFRYQVVEVQTPDGERIGKMDRWTGRVDLAPAAAPTPTPDPALGAAGRSFAGTWDTDLGPLTLLQDGTEISGEYSGKSAGTIEGKIVNGSSATIGGSALTIGMEYTWKEANGAEGSGVFSLEDGGNSIRGTWSTKGSTAGGEWTGKRRR